MFEKKKISFTSRGVEFVKRDVCVEGHLNINYQHLKTFCRKLTQQHASTTAACFSYINQIYTHSNLDLGLDAGTLLSIFYTEYLHIYLILRQSTERLICIMTLTTQNKAAQI